MPIVDERIVKMVFDNIQFEKAAELSISTLDKLKQSLNFDNASKSLSNISTAIGDFGASKAAEGIYVIQNSFNALDAVANRVIQNITDKLMNIGGDLFRKTMIEPISAGFQEYQTQIDSVQTILANTNDALIEKGLTTEHDRIAKINGVLDDLNHYADMTIYNFTEMTRNIGTFTAAGVDLDTAATSIKGIANLAAMSGSNSEQASRAMYQLSQAISSGAVKLQDWNSVVNSGMGGKLFQNELIDTAKAMGVADESFQKLINGETTFRESLQSGWISSEVLTNTLEKFTAGSEGYTKSQVEQMRTLWKARGYSEQQIDELVGSIDQLNEEEEKNLRTKWAEKGFSDEQIDHILSMGTAATSAATKVRTFTQLLDTIGEAFQSGWTQSWEYIIGDFEQAKMLWTEISDIMNLYIGKSANARNDVLKEWSRATYSYNENGELIKLTYNEAGELIEDADQKIIKDGKMVREEMGGRELVIQSLRNAFQGLFEVAIEFGSAWDQNFWGKGTQNDISITGQKLKDLSLALYDYTTNFKNAFTRNNDDAHTATGLLAELRVAFDGFSTAARNGVSGIGNILSGLGNIVKSVFNSSLFSVDTLNSIVTAFSAFTGRIRDFGEAFNKHFGSSNQANFDGLTKFFTGLTDFFETKIWTKIELLTNAFDGLGLVLEHVLEPFGTISEIAGNGGEKLSTLSNAFDNFLHNEDTSKFEGLFEHLAKSFNYFYDALRANIDFTGISQFFNQLVGIFNGQFGDKFVIVKNAFESALNLFKAAVGILTPVASAFTAIFGPWLLTAINYIEQLSIRFKDFTKSLVPSVPVINGLKTLFEGLFSVVRAFLNAGAETFFSLWDGLGKIFKALLPDGISFGEMLSSVGNNLKDFAQYINDVVSGEADVGSFGDAISLLTDRLANFISTIKDSKFISNFGTMFSNFYKSLKENLFGSADISLLEGITNGIINTITKLKNAFIGDNGLDAGDVFAGLTIVGVIQKLLDFFKDAKTKLKSVEKVKGVADIVNDVIETFTDTLEAVQDRLKFSAIQAFATSLLMIAGSLFIIASIDTVKLINATAVLSYMLSYIKLIMKDISHIENFNAADFAQTAGALLSISLAMVLLSVSASILGSMDIASLSKGLIAVSFLLGGLTAVAERFSQFNGDLAKGAGGLILMAVAINLLVIPVKILGGMDWKDLAKGLLATIALIEYLAIASITLGESKLNAKTGFALLLFAMGISVLSKAVVVLGEMPYDQLVLGLLSVIALLGVMAIVAGALSDTNFLASAAGIYVVAKAMVVLSDAVIALGAMPWKQLVKGIGAISASLLIMAVAIDYISEAASKKGIVAIGVLALALVPLAGSLKLLSGIKWTSLVKGLLAIAAAFAILYAAAYLFDPAMVGIVLGLSAAVALLGAAMAAFGIGMLAVSTAITGSGEMMMSFIESLITLFPRLAEAVAESVLSFLKTLSAGLPQIVKLLVEIGKSLLSVIKQLVPEIASTVTVVVRSVLTTIRTLAPDLMNTITTVIHSVLMSLQTVIPDLINTAKIMISSFIDAVVEFGPKMFNAAAILLRYFLQGLANNMSSIVDAGSSLIINFINGVANNIGGIVDAAFNLIISFINGLADAIDNNMEALYQACAHLVSSIIHGIFYVMDQLVNAGMDALGNFLAGFGANIDDATTSGKKVVSNIVGGIRQVIRTVWDAGVSIIRNVLSGIASIIGNLVNSGQSIVNNVKSGIGSIVGTLADKGREIVSNVSSGISSAWDWLRQRGADIVNWVKGGIDTSALEESGRNLAAGFANGIASWVDKVVAAAGDLARRAVAKVKEVQAEGSPSKVTFASGVFFSQGYINGIASLIKPTAKTAANLANTAIDAFNTPINNASLSVAPVFDDSEIQNGMAALSNLDTSGYILSASINDSDMMTMQHLYDINQTLSRQIGSLTNAIESMEPNNILDARGMVVNDRNAMSGIASDVINIFIRKGLM